MTRYAPTIFLSAFLLFQVQPLIAKYILPWFGGSPAVWTTCMLFFQMLLLGGYAYAHVTSMRLSPRSQAMLHMGLLIVSLALLPIIPSVDWKPSGSAEPTLRILGLLLVTVGLPYLMLSTTGPLLQRWFSRRYPTRSPYRLYALSNAGSLLALVTYPILFEPALQLPVQAVSWSWAYLGFVGFCALCAWDAARPSPQTPAELGSDAGGASAPGSLTSDAASSGAGSSTSASSDEKSLDEKSFDEKSRVPTAATAGTDSAGKSSAGMSAAGKSAAGSVDHPAGMRVLLWFLLAMVPSVMLLAVTNQMCQEVAVVPFLWVLPLSLYLLSFILCFEHSWWYFRPVWIPLMFAGVAGSIYCLYQGVEMPLAAQVAIYSATLFCCCMACHGELARSKPPARHLTLFYLMMAAGGAAGGVFVVAVAPLIFPKYWELHLGLVASCLLVVVAWHRASASGDTPLSRSRWAVPALLVFAVAGALLYEARREEENVLARARNFYGILTVVLEDHSAGPCRIIRHGRISHGYQYQDDALRDAPVSYYGPESGIGLAIRYHPRMLAGEQRSFRLGVVGLGAGTLAAYGRSGDVVRYYEINPVVVELSREYFTYVQDSPAEVDIVLGDARVEMERQLAEGRPQRFDVLAIDAFSSDAIPMHLLTRECFELYEQHLKEDGILAVHISNRYLALEPVVHTLAKELDQRGLLFEWSPSDRPEDRGLNACTWVLVTRNEQFIKHPEIREQSDRWTEETSRPLLWTDNYGSLLQVLD